MSSAEGYVLPKPGIPKTLGILNIIFGVMLVLYGTCTVVISAFAPMAMKSVEELSKKAQAKAEDDRKAQLKSFDDREAAAKDEEEKKKVTSEKDAFVAANPPVPNVDISAVTDVYKNPTIMGYTMAQMGSGVIMNIILIVAGIGLIRLKSWGRSLSLWLAGIQIVRLIILAGVSIIVVQPVSLEVTQKMLTKLEADAKVQNGPPAAAQNIEVAKAMASMGTIGAIAYVVFGSIYPIVTLILLNGAGARAACQSRKSPESPDFLA